MTDERMAITIGRANIELEKFRLDKRFEPYGLYEFGLSSLGERYTFGQRMFYANNVNVNFDMQGEVNRKAGSVDRDLMYKQKNQMSCIIDVDFLLSNDINSGYGDPYLFMRDDIPGGNATGKSFYAITIGENIYNKCYLNSINVEIAPFKPVTCRASFKCVAPASGEPIKGLYVAQNWSGSHNQLMDTDGFVLGHTCELSGWIENITTLDAISQISFTRTYGRKDIYCIGESLPRESLVKNVENTMVIRSSGFENMLPAEGIRISGDLGVIFKDSKGDRVKTQPLVSGTYHNLDPSIHIKSGAYVIAESYSIAEKGSVESVITIGEAIQ